MNKRSFKAKATAIIHNTIYCSGGRDNECDQYCGDTAIARCKKDLDRCLNSLWKVVESGGE